MPPQTKIGIVFHAYQPEPQQEHIRQQIFKESYKPIVDFIKENPWVFVSIDITRSIAERWPQDFIDSVKMIYNRGQIEFFNVAAYHTLFPFMPDHAAKRQLELNRESYLNYFGVKSKIKGVFLPELAFSQRIVNPINETGHSFIIADDGPFVYQRSFLPSHLRAPQNWIPTINGCAVFLRSREWSQKVADRRYHCGECFARDLVAGQKQWREACGNDSDSYIILAWDWETNGHHHKDAVNNFIKPFYCEIARQNNECEICSLEQICGHFPQIPYESMPDGSWSTNTEDMKFGTPFPLWNHPFNPFHRAWNEFKEIVFSIVPSTNPPAELQYWLDRAFSSCAPWWAAKNDKEQRQIASWWFPHFTRIIKLLSEMRFPAEREKEKEAIINNLNELYKMMQNAI